jgi:hypothetical protein
LSNRLKDGVQIVLGVLFIVFGVLFATVRNVQYAPGDVRGSDAYNWLSGAVIIAIGGWLILSVRYPKLRGPWRRRDE